MVVELFIPKPPSSSFSSIAVASGLLDPMFASGELFEASDEPEVVKVPLTRSKVMVTVLVPPLISTV